MLSVLLNVQFESKPKIKDIFIFYANRNNNYFSFWMNRIGTKYFNFFIALK